jgi:hypothetical protein
VSWWISLEDTKGRILEVEPFEEGGTYMLGGTTQADLNITYNYSGLFAEAWPEDLDKRPEAGDGTLGKMLHCRVAAVTQPLLSIAIDKLLIAAGGVEAAAAEESSYWDATPRNAALPLIRLEKWAIQHPLGIWNVR